MGRRLLEVVILLPMVLPPTVLGYYMLIALGRQSTIGKLYESVIGSSIVFTPTAAVIAAFVASSPFLIRTAQGAFESLDECWEDVARTLGRNELSIFFTITVPLAWRGIAAGIALTFARAIGEFGATLMLAGNIPNRTQTASLAVYDAVQAGNTSYAAQLALVLSLTTALALVVLTGTGRRRQVRLTKANPFNKLKGGDE